MYSKNQMNWRRLLFFFLDRRKKNLLLHLLLSPTPFKELLNGAQLYDRDEECFISKKKIVNT